MWRKAAIAAGVSLLTVSGAYAVCECPQATPEELLDLATFAFSGKVAEILTERSTGKKTIVFDVVDSFKGSPTPEMKFIDGEANTACDMEFTPGVDYLIYARWEWGKIVTSRCYGSKRLEKAVKEVKQLGPADAAKEKQYDQMNKYCMGRKDTPCCLASVKAMRAGYYLLEPENGCPDGQVPDRLRCAGSHVWCVPISEMKARKP